MMVTVLRRYLEYAFLKFLHLVFVFLWQFKKQPVRHIELIEHVNIVIFLPDGHLYAWLKVEEENVCKL